MVNLIVSPMLNRMVNLIILGMISLIHFMITLIVNLMVGLMVIMMMYISITRASVQKGFWAVHVNIYIWVGFWASLNLFFFRISCNGVQSVHLYICTIYVSQNYWLVFFWKF